jgi:hypothetical protein
MTTWKMTLALGGRSSIAGCALLACLSFASADFGNAVTVDQGEHRASQSTDGNDRWARGGPLHLFPSEYRRDGGSGTACDANKRISKTHCVPEQRRLCGENQ